MLESREHRVVTFVEDNARLNETNPFRAAMEAVWSWEVKGRIARQILEVKPDIVHFHNTFLRISPATYYAAKEAGGAGGADASQLPPHLSGRSSYA